MRSVCHPPNIRGDVRPCVGGGGWSGSPRAPRSESPGTSPFFFGHGPSTGWVVCGVGPPAARGPKACSHPVDHIHRGGANPDKATTLGQTTSRATQPADTPPFATVLMTGHRIFRGRIATTGQYAAAGDIDGAPRRGRRDWPRTHPGTKPTGTVQTRTKATQYGLPSTNILWASKTTTMLGVGNPKTQCPCLGHLPTPSVSAYSASGPTTLRHRLLGKAVSQKMRPTRTAGVGHTVQYLHTTDRAPPRYALDSDPDRIHEPVNFPGRGRPASARLF